MLSLIVSIATDKTFLGNADTSIIMITLILKHSGKYFPKAVIIFLIEMHCEVASVNLSVSMCNYVKKWVQM